VKKKAPSEGELALRITLALALAVLGLMLAAATTADATPITPSVDQLIKQAQKPPVRFAPAHAGWNGPLMAPAKPAADGVPEDFNQLLDQAALQRASRAEVRRVAVPDPRIVVGLAMLIFLLRKWRQMHKVQPAEPIAPEAPSLPQAA
jgi:hypothetical protein